MFISLCSTKLVDLFHNIIQLLVRNGSCVFHVFLSTGFLTVKYGLFHRAFLVGTFCGDNTLFKVMYQKFFIELLLP